MINICILICGVYRTLDLIIDNLNNLFNNTDIYKLNFYLSIKNDNKIFFEKYNNINKILIINDIYTNEFLNSLNYIYKFDNGLKIINSIYDLYIIIRSDLFLEEIPFIDNNNQLNLDLIEDNMIYFSNKNINQFTVYTNNKLNESIIITKNYNYLILLNNIYNYTLKNNNYLNIIFYDYLNEFNIKYKNIDIKYKLILSKCNIIAISGDSGSGKSTLANILKSLYNNNNYLLLETDRYHKWERNDINYNTYTHLNPESNFLEKMYYDLYNLKIGNEIFQVDYDHNTGKFTQKEKIEAKDNIILCGLHTLYNNEINKIINLKIYMDTDNNLKKKWKIDRDINNRGYNINKIIEQINNRKYDYEKYILNQKNNADIIIHFYELEYLIKCKIIIQNNNIINIIIKYLINNKYIIIYDNNNIIFDLITNEYYKEIYNIINYLYNNNNNI
jgi:uridine kinase